MAQLLTLSRVQQFSHSGKPKDLHLIVVTSPQIDHDVFVTEVGGI